MSGASTRRRRLVDSLRRDGTLTEPHWIDAFSQVPRHVFLPRFFVPHGQRWAAVAWSDPSWLEHVYSPNVLVTQLDDEPSAWVRARCEGPITGTPTCSSSMPAIMSIMLEELHVHDRSRVLEVGTGTGYNAGLLSQRLGSSFVSSVDIDPALVAGAREALRYCGFTPRCEVADGAAGFPAEAPYDRVLCTCSVSHIPPAWLEQTRPGGLIVTTLNRPIGAGMVRIVVGEGGTGEGRVLVRDGRFMPLRAHRLGTAGALLTRPRRPRRPGSVLTSLPLTSVLSPASRFEFYAGLELGATTAVHDPADPEATFLAHPDGSWARHHACGGGFAVERGGPRDLWDLVEKAHADWLALGEPGRERFGITVAPGHQELWLDTPDSEARWPLPVPVA